MTYLVLTEHTLADVAACWPIATLETECRASYAVDTWSEAITLARAQFPGIAASLVLSRDECLTRLKALQVKRRHKATYRQHQHQRSR